MARRGLFELLSCLLFGVMSCSSGVANAPDDSPIKWVDVVPASYSFDGLGVPISFTPVGEDRTGSPVPADMFDWSSSAPNVVSVETPGGVGMVMSYGAATVTVAAGGRTGAAILLASPDPWSNDAKIEVVSRADAISAAVLGVGPLSAKGVYYACSYPGLWTSFPRGTSVNVRVSNSVKPDVRDAVHRGLLDIWEVTGGALSSTFEVTTDPNPIPGRNEVTVTVHPTPSAFGCRRDVGCTLHEFEKPGVLRSSRVILPSIQTANAFVHDAIGHGILGMCHVDAGRIGRAEHSLMSNGPFTNSSDIAPSLSHLDIEIQQAVWATSLSPGADSRAFRTAGLIRP